MITEKEYDPNEIIQKRMEIKIDGAGHVSAVVATFKLVDHDGDIIEPTAFTDGQEMAMVWSHDWSDPIGKGVIHVTETQAIFEGDFFMDTTRGAEAYKTVKAMGDLQEWSWGFISTKRQYEDTPDGSVIRRIIEAEIYEVSPVLKGAGIGTGTLTIKQRTSLETEIKSLCDSADSLGERIRSVVGLRQSQGKSFGVEKAAKIHELATALRDSASFLEKNLEGDEPSNEALKEYIKYQQTEARLNGVGKDM
jgi:HK97 family phage prohead protease